MDVEPHVAFLASGRTSGRGRLLRQEMTLFFVFDVGQLADSGLRVFSHVAETRQRAAGNRHWADYFLLLWICG